jgi:hypothetical protein
MGYILQTTNNYLVLYLIKTFFIYLNIYNFIYYFEIQMWPQ